MAGLAAARSYRAHQSRYSWPKPADASITAPVPQPDRTKSTVASSACLLIGRAVPPPSETYEFRSSRRSTRSAWLIASAIPAWPPQASAPIAQVVTASASSTATRSSAHASTSSTAPGSDEPMLLRSARITRPNELRWRHTRRCNGCSQSASDTPGHSVMNSVTRGPDPHTWYAIARPSRWAKRTWGVSTAGLILRAVRSEALVEQRDCGLGELDHVGRSIVDSREHMSGAHGAVGARHCQPRVAGRIAVGVDRPGGATLADAPRRAEALASRHRQPRRPRFCGASHSTFCLAVRVERVLRGACVDDAAADEVARRARDCEQRRAHQAAAAALRDPDRFLPGLQLVGDGRREGGIEHGEEAYGRRWAVDDVSAWCRRSRTVGSRPAAGARRARSPGRGRRHG